MDEKDIFISTQEVHVDRKPTEKKILTAASKIMYQNGFASSIMSAIAAEAGVTEPTLYQHFENKVNLLFSVVEWQTEHSFHFLNEHLQGITGAHNKLRKLIWAHLRYNDQHPEYITLVLTECRPNYNFYRSTAYKVIRKYAGTILSLIHEGIEEGVFRSDLNPRLIRAIILGLLDFENYTVMLPREIPEAVPDHGDIMRLLDRIMLNEPKCQKREIGKRQAILSSALQAFAKKGYAGATISEIANASGVSDGTVYEYFKNKEDLLLSIPEDRFKCHLAHLQEAFNVQSKEGKLRRFIQDHFRLYLSDKDFLIVYLLLIQLNRRFKKTRAYESLRSYIEVFEKIVREGIEANDFASDTNVRVFRNMFLGVFTHMSLRWFVAGGKKNYDKFTEINEVTDLLLRAIKG
jgi:TetR/AcrR family transcriptional regulator, fatty acid metabolism regulator protein